MAASSATRKAIHPRDLRVFFGALDPGTLGIRDRAIRALPAGQGVQIQFGATEAVMSDQMLKLAVGGVLLVHGLGHGGALGALLWIRMRPGTTTGDWAVARTWLMPTLPAKTASVLASAFWIASLVGFVLAALSFWGLILPADVWRPVALSAAVISMAGVVLFIGTWPSFNTVAALAVNVGVLLAVWIQWPPQSVFGG